MNTSKAFTTCGGEVVELANVRHSGAVSVKAREFSGRCPTCGELHTAERRIDYKNSPSLHKCDGRCMGAKGHVCECSCDGKNHGRAAA